MNGDSTDLKTAFEKWSIRADVTSGIADRFGTTTHWLRHSGDFILTSTACKVGIT